MHFLDSADTSFPKMETPTTVVDRNPSSVALIIGVTGMVGLSLAEALNNPSTRGGPWKVYGVARRSLPTWFPASLLHEFISMDALDQQDTLTKLSPVASEVTHVFWVALVVDESEEVNISMNSSMISHVIQALKSSGEKSRLKHFTLQTGTKHYMGPIYDPEHRSKIVMHNPPFREDMPRLPYPNFYYAQEDILVSTLPKGVTHSIHRSSIIIGATPRSLFNPLLSLSIYATICKYKCLPFRYPGNKYTWEHFCDMSDSRLLAEQQIWAATTEVAKNQAFNCTNGDVITWKEVWRILCQVKEVWRILCQVFELEFDENGQLEFDVIGMMNDGKMGDVWDEIVERHGLVKTKLGDVTCFDAITAVTHFEFQHVCSMNKSKEFGFMGYCNTLKSIPFWVNRMRDLKIIP